MAPWIAGAMVALTVSWAADGLRDIFEAWMRGEAVNVWMVMTRVVYVLLFMAAATWLYRMRNMLFQPRTRFLRSESPEKREHLVLFLSNLDTRRGPFHNGVPEGITLRGDLEQDLAALVDHKRQTRQYWPWEMPLRAIRHHLGRLQTITIICSPESLQQVHWFGQVLMSYGCLHGVSVRVFLQDNGRPVMAECPKEPMTMGGWDFEQFDALSQAILHLIREFKKQRVTDDQIMIDFTGGQKVTSVVAASVTFNRTIKAQYVQTNPPYAVISYDILLGSPETGGLGL
jgi:hypothetical protein